MRAHAPGKLFVTGEWAVLAGAPAIVCAVDRRATVEIVDDDRPIRCRSVVDGTDAVALTEAPRRGDAGAVAAAWRATGCVPTTGLVTVDAAAFLDGREKLGLGRSAAVLVAGTAAFLARQGVRDARAIQRTALAANHDFQSGRGSGADVAAAVHGGVIEFRRTGDAVTVTPRVLPEPWRLMVGWTGIGAATVPLLDRLAAAPARPASLQALIDIAIEAAAACAAGDMRAFTATFATTTAALADLGCALDQPIVTPALRLLVDVAAGLGIAAKPSGAGGGDCGIALVDGPDRATALRDAWYASGIVPVDVTIDPSGLAHA